MRFGIFVLFLLLPGLAFGGEKQSGAFVPLLSSQEAWKCLPKAEKGADTPLPNWALALVKSLPRTTAAMLELDYVHRAASPLDAKLRGRIRLVAAQANRCAYSQAQAEADLARAGVGDVTEVPADEKAVLPFARKMTLAANTVTDEEVADLIKTHGEKKVAAMVLLLAYSNFQDRLLLTLGIPTEKDGPAPPREIRFSRENTDTEVPARPAWKGSDESAPKRVDDAEWLRFDIKQLKKNMEVQKERKPRITVPAWDDVKKQLPEGARELRIKWSLVCLGYQPEMAMGWSACTRAFAQEAAMDRVFEESLFWVVTRTLQCFY